MLTRARDPVDRSSKRVEIIIGKTVISVERLLKYFQMKLYSLLFMQNRTRGGAMLEGIGFECLKVSMSDKHSNRELTNEFLPCVALS